MIDVIKNQLDGRRFVSLKEIRQLLGKDAMECFLSEHQKAGFLFCPECNYYVREEGFDTVNNMCVSCKNRVVEVASFNDADDDNEYEPGS